MKFIKENFWLFCYFGLAVLIICFWIGAITVAIHFIHKLW